MAKYGNLDIKGLKEFQAKLNKLNNPDVFVESCAKELAARLLGLVIQRTPRGDYSKEIVVTAKRNSKYHKKGEQYTKKVSTGKEGGTLIRGWTGGKDVSAKEYAENLQVQHVGDTYKIEIVNPVEYAPYVEYGHRKRNHGWVRGKFMMTISENELRTIAPKVLENKIKKYMNEVMK